jgi:hypothetical protein
MTRWRRRHRLESMEREISLIQGDATAGLSYRSIQVFLKRDFSATHLGLFAKSMRKSCVSPIMSPP